MGQGGAPSPAQASKHTPATPRVRPHRDEVAQHLALVVPRVPVAVLKCVRQVLVGGLVVLIVRRQPPCVVPVQGSGARGEGLGLMGSAVVIW